LRQRIAWYPYRLYQTPMMSPRLLIAIGWPVPSSVKWPSFQTAAAQDWLW